MAGHAEPGSQGAAPAGRLLGVPQLRAELGESPLRSPDESHLALDAARRGVLSQQAAIVEHQWREEIRHGMVRGFCLSGPPGTGKTTLAKALGYELGLRFRDGSGLGMVVTVLIDGADVARAKYGASEQQIRGIFQAAEGGFGRPGRRSVLIFDDVESIFMSRGSATAKEWHYSQDSVFFHAVDELDTSRSVVVLTTNRPDLVDDAIRDRFLGYEVGYPSAGLLVEAARRRAAEQRYSADQLAGLTAAVRDAIAAGRVRSIRDAQHAALAHYISCLPGTA